MRRRVEFLFHDTSMVTDELVNLRRAVYSRPGLRPSDHEHPGAAGPGDPRGLQLGPVVGRQVVAPTLLLWTDHDPTGGLDEAEMLLDWLPDARLHVITDAGHWPQWEKVDDFLAAHRAFLRDEKDPS